MSIADENLSEIEIGCSKHDLHVSFNFRNAVLIHNPDEILYTVLSYNCD